MTRPQKQSGRALAEHLNPGVHEALTLRYGHILPGMAETISDVAYGEFYGRPGLDLKTRYVATIAALTAQGGQTRPQLKINIAAGRKAGLSQIEVAEVIWQMALYGGMPAAINALNAALEVFEEEDAK
ncbi:carboxymuconolactone decarboxylase family protein [Roseibium algae]|uniref:Carboxymuconolactone decarboxylase family protein n=1 Tax=Roseibium algae TaxID=3123038 RepID=A0ABU8TJ68_9HYPH